MKLRTRLLAVTMLTLALGMTAFCAAGDVLFAHAITVAGRQRAAARLTAAAATLSLTHGGSLRRHEPVNDQTLDSLVWIIAPGGRILEAPPHVAPALTRLAQDLTRAGRPMTTLAAHGTLLRSGSLSAHRRRVATVVAGVSITQLQALQRTVLIGSVAVLVLTLLVGAVAVRRALTAALGPVARMTREAEDWGAHDLERRFDLGPAHDEITALAATLDHLLQRIANSRRHEQRFASEVAHELRTPLAAIRATAELAVAESDIGRTQTALAQIERLTRRIGSTIDTLVALARREASPTPQTVDLQAIAADFGVDLRCRGARRLSIEGDPDVIRQTLAPLVDNARRYAHSSVHFEVTVDDAQTTVAVCDDGPGVDPELRASIFRPGVRASGDGDGAGLGLPLARRLAESCGGTVVLGEGPGGCFLLRLPSSAIPPSQLAAG